MTKKALALSFLASIAVLAGCDLILGNELNPKFCKAHLDDEECRREFSLPCTKSSQCPAPTAVCQVETGTCVQCSLSEPESCTGNAPVCGVENTCSACSKHTDCASAACLPDGSCAAENTVAYVAPAGAGKTCSRTGPCKTVKDALETARPYVKFSGVTDEAVTVDKGRQVTFLSDAGAKLTRGTGGAILTVKDDGTSLSVYDLAISDAPNNASGYGVLVAAGSGAPAVRLVRVTLQNNPAGGISVAGGALTVTQSTVSGNQGGGISVTGGAFDINNSFIVGNGGADMITGSDFGGLSLSAGVGANRLERNTVAYNHAKQGTLLAAGIGCSVTNLVAPGNIVTSNNEGLTFPAQTKGVCTYGNSYSVPGSEMNTLRFKSITTNPPDFHLTAASPTSVLDAGGACTGVDIDGDTRPGGTACDLGADEVP
jgi:Right handed beta helix region